MKRSEKIKVASLAALWVLGLSRTANAAQSNFPLDPSPTPSVTVSVTPSPQPSPLPPLPSVQIGNFTFSQNVPQFGIIYAQVYGCNVLANRGAQEYIPACIDRVQRYITELQLIGHPDAQKAQTEFNEIAALLESGKKGKVLKEAIDNFARGLETSSQIPAEKQLDPTVQSMRLLQLNLAESFRAQGVKTRKATNAFYKNPTTKTFNAMRAQLNARKKLLSERVEQMKPLLEMLKNSGDPIALEIAKLTEEADKERTKHINRVIALRKQMVGASPERRAQIQRDLQKISLAFSRKNAQRNDRLASLYAQFNLKCQEPGGPCSLPSPSPSPSASPSPGTSPSPSPSPSATVYNPGAKLLSPGIDGPNSGSPAGGKTKGSESGN